MELFTVTFQKATRTFFQLQESTRVIENMGAFVYLRQMDSCCVLEKHRAAF